MILEPSDETHQTLSSGKKKKSCISMVEYVVSVVISYLLLLGNSWYTWVVYPCISVVPVVSSTFHIVQ